MKRPIERPLIRKQYWDGTNVPGWRVVVNFEDGHNETTWQTFENAMKWARHQVPDPTPADLVSRAFRRAARQLSKARPLHLPILGPR